MSCGGVLCRRTKNLTSYLLRNKNVAMFHIGRCGSTVVGNMLNEHPDIFWASEIFEGKRNFGLNSIEKLRFVENVIQESCYSQVKKVYGFETKYLPQTHLSQECISMSLQDYINLLKNINFSKFIVLHRRNYLKRLVSGEVGRQKGKWHSEQDIVIPHPVKIDVEEFRYGNCSQSLLNLFRSFDENYHLIQKLLSEKNPLLINYEDDILDDPNKAYKKVCEYLEVKSIPIKISLKRTNPFSLNEMVENFDEVKSYLGKTPYEWMLYSD